RSALSTLLPQSNGNLPVTILMSRRFASAAAVRRDASHHQAATIMAKAPTSAAPLNAPRPAARPMSITGRFTITHALTHLPPVPRRGGIVELVDTGALWVRR